MGKYKFKCDYCDKKFLNAKVFKRQHKASFYHKKNMFSYYHQTLLIQGKIKPKLKKLYFFIYIR